MAIPISNQERSLWEFAKIGESNIVPEIVGSLLYGPQNTVPLIFGNSHVAFSQGLKESYLRASCLNE